MRNQMRNSKQSIPQLKGVYTMNPTKSIMKAGSAASRKAVTSDVTGFKKPKKVKGLNK